MKTHFFRQLPVIAASTFAFLSPLGVHAHEATLPEVRQVGRTAIVYKGAQVELALSYRYAASKVEGQWLLLDTSMTATRSPVEIKRSAIAVRTPAGDIVPLATQEAFATDYSVLAPAIARANVAQEPMGYLLPDRYRRLDFFSQPGRHLVFPTAWLDELHNSFGRLFFKLPGGVTKGNYELLIDVSGGQVAIPFTI